MTLAFDHLAVMAETLEEGVAFVEETLGVSPTGGGQHPNMGTWNKVMRLGPGEYLEIITVDPGAEAPPHPRWFNLDHFSGPPRLASWICRSTDLEADLAQAVPEVGQGVPLSRGDLSWVIALSGDGKMPFDGAHPGFIEWKGPHPADRMADLGLRLTGLSITHPDPALAEVLKLSDPRVEILTGDAISLSATIETPQGVRRLG